MNLTQNRNNRRLVQKMKYSACMIAALAVFICQNEAKPSEDLKHLSSKAIEIRLSLEPGMTELEEQAGKKFEEAVKSFQEEVERRIECIPTPIKLSDNEDCLQPLKSAFDEAHRAFVISLNECKNRNIPTWGNAPKEWNVQPQAESLVSRLEAIEAEMEYTRRSCAGPSADAFEICVARELPRLTDMINSKQESATKVRSYGQIMTGRACINFGICIKKSPSDFEKKVESAKDEAYRCINE